MGKGMKAALGFTNTVDYEAVWSRPALERLFEVHNVTEQDVCGHARIRTMRDLLGSVLFHFSNGTGCGLFVENAGLVDRLAEAFECRIALGGTAVRAALALSRLGRRSLVHLVSRNQETLRMLPGDVRWVCSQQRETLYPHVTLQFNKGERLSLGRRVYTAPRANRVIYTSDMDNALLRIEPAFFEAASEASVLVLSSFDIIQRRALLEDRLRTVRRGLASLRGGLRVMYEDAHFSHEEFPPMIWEALAPYIHFYSMNEEEFARYAHLRTDAASPGEWLSALEALAERIGTPCLIVHASRWALAYGDLANEAAPGLAAGVAVASTRYRLGDSWTVADVSQTRRLPHFKGADSFAGQLMALAPGKLRVVPSYEARPDTATTIGLGDSFVGGFASEAGH